MQLASVTTVEATSQTRSLLSSTNNQLSHLLLSFSQSSCQSTVSISRPLRVAYIDRTLIIKESLLVKSLR